MRSLSYLVGLLSVVFPLVAVHGAPHSGLSVFESLPTIPRGWIQGEAVPSSKRLRFRIAIKQQNAHAFEQHVLDISTPDHPKYGEHMTREELKAMLRPSAEASESVVGWLESVGVSPKDIEDDGDWVNFYVPAVEAERILDTKLVTIGNIERWLLYMLKYVRFYYYESSINGATRIRTLHYSVPETVRQYVQMIQPTTRFGQMRPERSNVFESGDGVAIEEVKEMYQEQAILPGFNATFCNTTITPTCLRQLYRGTSGSNFGVEGSRGIQKRVEGSKCIQKKEGSRGV